MHRLISALFALALIFPPQAFSLPEGESVVAGAATFDRSLPGILNINTPSDNLIVNYDSFNIAQPETVNFNQPSAGSVALNRVVGADPSSIFGTLTANGKIFLINPNGVMFGPGSRVDAPALIASTLDISNPDFLNGSYNFFKNGESAFLINQGNIKIGNGGYACLLSQAVENQGVIQADLGTVVLASGEKMALSLDDLNDISVVIDEPVKEAVFGADGQKIGSAIKNTGTISTNGGKVILTTKILNDVFDYAINNEGIIEATSLVNSGGTVELVTTGAPVRNIGKIDPFVGSDKHDYAPYEKPVISGSGFAPNSEITITITSPEGETATLTTFTDAQGEFVLHYSPATLTSGAYSVRSTDGARSVLSTFTDQLPNILASILINSGATYTNDTNVTLVITASAPNGPFILSYRLGNDDASSGTEVGVSPTFNFASGPIYPWVITSGDGSKTVAVQFKIGLPGVSESWSWTQNYVDTIILDQTPPTIVPVRTPAANIYGWNNTAVTVSYTVDDNLSGVNPNPPSDYGDDVFNSEGAGFTADGIVYDNAGNWATASVADINIDFTPPVVDITSPVSGLTYILPQTLLYNVFDALSGIADVSGPASGTVYDANGTYSIMVTATDRAGNVGSDSTRFIISILPPPESTLNLQEQLRYKLPYLEQFAPNQVNPFDFITSSDLYGPVYFYSPLTESDSSAFAAFEVGDDAYEFINGSLNMIGHDGLLQFLQLFESKNR